MVVGRRSTLTTGLFALAVSSALICGPAASLTPVRPPSLVNTIIGIGGRDDPTSQRLPAKLSQTFVHAGDSYVATGYPATIELDNSVRIGMPVLRGHLDASSGKVLVAGYSLGALLTEQLKRDIAASPDAPSRWDLSFLQIATPFVPNGGIFARFPGVGIPFIVSPMGPGQPTRYDTTYVVNEYDPWGDFPAYFNPLALLNSVLGLQYAHIDSYYDTADPADLANHVKAVTDLGTGGTETYILMPNQHLPLLGPLRDIADRLGVTPLAERVLGAIEPLLRVLVDMAYTDRVNLNPEVATPFSLFTPPHKILEAINAVPGALHEGLQNLLGAQSTPAAPPADATSLVTETADTPRQAGDDADREPATVTPLRQRPRTAGHDTLGDLDAPARRHRTGDGPKTARPAAESAAARSPGGRTPSPEDHTDQDNRVGGAEAA